MKKNNPKEKRKTLLLDDKKFRAFIEKSFDVIVVVNARGKVLYASPSIVRLYGRPFSEVIGVNGLRYIHPFDISKITLLLSQIIRRPKKLITVELRIKHKNGQWRWVKARATNLLKDKNVKGIVVNFNDITERKVLEERKDEFISLASHELKTPITSLKAYVQLLRRRYNSSDEFLSNSLEKINNQISRLTRLINELLDVSRIQEGKISLHKEHFAIGEIINSVVEDMRQAFPGREIIIKRISQKMIFADKLRITQILTNLLSNAIKYSPKSSPIFVNIRENEKSFSISVKDFGMGISKENTEKIFERFYQDRKTREHGLGLGLGLYIVSTFIKQHGGKIWVKSEKGKGAVFTFSIPR